MAAVAQALRLRRRGMATVAVAVAAAAVAAAAIVDVAAVPPPPAGGWGRAVRAAAAATLPSGLVVARLAAVARPLSPTVSVFTDGAYGPVDSVPVVAGCPSSLAIAGELTIANNTFLVPAAAVTIDGAACAGATAGGGLGGLFGPPLADALADINATNVVELDPKAALGVGFQGPLTCGGQTWLGDNTAFVFAVQQGVPIAVYVDGAAPTRECGLAVTEGGAASPTPAAATPTPA